MPRDIRFTHIVSRTSEVAVQLQRLHFSEYRPPSGTWGPAVNAIMDEHRIEICVDLAGVARDEVQVSLEGRRLSIRGARQVLDPQCRAATGCRVLMMEIDEGPFERLLTLPAEIDFDADRVTARQENGMLRIEIPLRG